MLVTPSILFIICIILFLVYLYNTAKNVPKNFPPGPPRLPLWGSYLYVLKENYFHPQLAFEALGKKYNTDILGLYLGDFPAVVTLSNELCKEMLTRDEFTGRNDTIILRTRSLGELKGILFMDGPMWKDERRFSLRNLRDFGFGTRSPAVEEFVTNEVKYLINLFDSEPDNDIADVCRGKREYLFPDVFYGPLLNSILILLTSNRFDNYKLRELARAGLRFQRSGDATGSTITIMPWLRFVAPDFFGYTPAEVDVGYLLDFLKGQVEEHLKTFSKEHYRDFIDVYIGERSDENQDFDYKQLLLTLLDYMFPTAISVGHTLSFLFACLVNNAHIQLKIQEEIDQVVGRSRLPNLDDRKLMPYLEASIREVMRLIPINPLGVPRRCLQDTTLGGYFVPKDAIMIPCIWDAHRDAKIWNNVEEFSPERFLDDSGNLLKKDYTMAFGAGRRLCVGETFARQNMFLIVSGLLQNFRFKTSTGEPVKFDIVAGAGLSLKENWIVAESR